MATFLASEIEHLREQATRGPGDPSVTVDWTARSRDAADLAAVAVVLLDRIDATAARRHPPTWDEATARREIPLYRAWFDLATAVKDLRSACAAHGAPVEGGDDFYHAYNRAKMMATDFDSLVESNRRFVAGERTGRPLNEILDEVGLRDLT